MPATFFSTRKPAARRLARACRPVIEALESRQLLSGTIQTLPFSLDFSSDRGGILDKDGQGIGFTTIQANKLGTQYQPSLIDLDTTNGVLNLTTTGTSTAGSNSNNDNTLVNGLETQFNATTSGFKITTRLSGPQNQIASPSEQAGVMFGPDQDNFIKFVAISQPSGQVLQFADEESSNGTTFTHQVSQTVSIGSFATISTLDLQLVGDAATGTVSAYYSLNGGSFTKMSKTVTLTGTFKSNFFTSAGTAGIIACAKNDLPPVTMSFDSFSIAAGQPVNAHPSVTASRPTNGDVGVSRDAFISANVRLPNPGATIDTTTLTSSNVQLFRNSDKLPITLVLSTSNGGDQIVATPASLLDPNTTYTFQIGSGVQDTAGSSFTPYSVSFTTGSTGGVTDPSLAFQKVALTTAGGQDYTVVTIGPDGDLYAGTDQGLIQRFTINSDGTLGAAQNITSLTDLEGNARLISGMAFDPSSTPSNLILWVANGDAATSGTSDWTGKITKLTGANLQTAQDAVINLPRATTSPSTNQLAFGPDGALYFAQGSMSDMGSPDDAWGQRSEHLLSSAILRLDTTKVGSSSIDVKTDSGGTYNPFATGAPVTIYATGVRDGTDLVWTSDGKLYVPSSGATSGGNTPGTPTSPYSFGANQRIDFSANGAYTGPDVPAETTITQTESDVLLNIAAGGYYGQPNPLRGEFVLNGGNPTSGIDANEITAYPVGTQPDRNFRTPAYSFGTDYLPGGIIQYSGSGTLSGKLLMTSAGSNQILVLTRAGDGTISTVQSNISGLTNFVDPVDIAENNATGFLYVASDGGQTLTLLRPVTPGAALTTNKSQMVFNDPTSSGASPGNTITITNTGTSALTLPSNAFTLTGTNAGRFSITSKPSLPTSLAPGASVNVVIAFTSNAIGIVAANLQITSGDPNNPIINIPLRGLGTAGTGGANEPSLQRVLDLYQIPDTVGDSNPDDTFLDNPPVTPNDEVTMQQLMKAGNGPVTITPIAVFGVSSTTAATARFGYYTPGDRNDITELLNVSGSTNSQTVNPGFSGATSFDPGSGAFGVYANFPAMYPSVYNVPGGTWAYSEDALNAAYDPNSPRKVRFYPLKNADGTIVPNAYVMATEDFNAGYDTQDFVAIIRNVKAAPAGPQIGFVNEDGGSFSDRLVFNRIQIEPPDPVTNADGSITQPPNNVVHDTEILDVTDSGTSALNISSMTISSGFQIVNAPTTPFSIAAGATIKLTVQFVATSGGVVNGTLVIKSNDSDQPTSTIQLSGYWENKSEHVEPILSQVNQVLGYGTTITAPGQNIDQGGAIARVGDEVLSGMWKKADSLAPVSVRQLASFHTQGNNAFIRYYTVNSSGTVTQNNLFTMDGTEAQSLFPHEVGAPTTPAYATFTTSSAFGFRVDSEWSEDSRNTIPAGSTTDQGHHVRFFVAKDESGNVIPDTYIMVMDYSGINYDYNDNVYLITNIKPVSPPAAPTGLSAAPGGSGMQLDWSDNTEANLGGYNVYYSSSATGTFTKINQILLSTSDFNDVNAPVEATAYYEITAVDVDGNESAVATINATRLTDTTPPATPANLIATGSQSSIVLKWSNNTDSDLAGYNVYRSDSFSGAYTLLNTGGVLTSATYVDSAAPSGVTSYYRVTAVDTSANESAANVANAIRSSGDTTPPNAPSNATATPSTSTIALDWSDNGESDLAGYNVYRSTSQFGTYTKLNAGLLGSSQYSDTTAPAGSTSWYHITAVDTSANESVATTVSAIRAPDTTPPATPTGLTATPGSTRITLDWADNTESDLAGYNVYSSSASTGPFTKLNSSPLNVSTYIDTSAAAGAVTYYRVTAVDSSGNESGHDDISATLPDSVPPAAPTSFAASGSFSGVSLIWVNGTEPDFAGINVYRSAAVDGIFVKINSALVTGTTYVDTTAPGGVTSFYQITAVDTSGNESTPAAASAFRPNLGLNANANDIAYDSTGVLHLAYYDTIAKTIDYASRTTDGTWSAIQIVDTSGDDVGGWLSIAVDSQNRPAIAYFDGTRGDLRYAILSGGVWNVQTVDSKNSVGLFPSLKFDSSDHPVIAYYKKTTGDLRIAQSDGTNWNITEIATADDVGRSASLARQPNGLWAIAYENSTAGRLQYAYQTSATVWQNVTVDISTAGISYISLAFDTSGRASISYQETGLGDLKFALNKNGKWTTGTIASKGSVGMYTRLVYGADGIANIFYYSKQLNTLMQARGYLGNWTITQLQSGGGRFISAVLAPDSTITYTWLDSASQVLTLDQI